MAPALSFCTACIVLAAALAFAAAWQLAPVVQRLWRLPRALVPAHAKAADALRVGLLGASTIGRIAFVHAADKRRDVITAAVAARDAARAAAYASRHGINASYGNYSVLLARADLDAVYISLPTQLHRRWTLAALAAGKHVLVEKPLAANAAEAEELRAAATRAGLVLMEAAHYRYHPAALRVRELLGQLGHLQSLTARFSMLDPKVWLAPARESSHERVKNLDRWWYCVDVLLWATHALSAHVEWASEGRFSLSAGLVLTLPEANRVTATIEMARDKIMSPFDWSFAAEGERGRLRFSNVGFPFIWHAIDLELTSPGPTATRRREQLYGAGETTFEHQLGAFVAAVRAGKTLEGDLTPQVVDEILRTAGGGSIPSLE